MASSMTLARLQTSSVITRTISPREVDPRCLRQHGTIVQISSGDKQLLRISQVITHDRGLQWTIKPRQSFLTYEDVRYRKGIIDVLLMNEEGMRGDLLHVIYTPRQMFHLFQLFQLRRRSTAGFPIDMDMLRIPDHCHTEVIHSLSVIHSCMSLSYKQVTMAHSGMNPDDHNMRMINMTLRNSRIVNIRSSMRTTNTRTISTYNLFIRMNLKKLLLHLHIHRDLCILRTKATSIMFRNPSTSTLKKKRRFHPDILPCQPILMNLDLSMP